MVLLPRQRVLNPRLYIGCFSHLFLENHIHSTGPFWSPSTNVLDPQELSRNRSVDVLKSRHLSPLISRHHHCHKPALLLDLSQNVIRLIVQFESSSARLCAQVRLVLLHTPHHIVHTCHLEHVPVSHMECSCSTSPSPPFAITSGSKNIYR